MYIKHKFVITPSDHSNLEVSIVATDNTELQIQIENELLDNFYFDIDLNQAKAIREALTEFIGDNN